MIFNFLIFHLLKFFGILVDFETSFSAIVISSKNQNHNNTIFVIRHLISLLLSFEDKTVYCHKYPYKKLKLEIKMRKNSVAFIIFFNLNKKKIGYEK